jgi:hypothetical protein
MYFRPRIPIQTMQRLDAAIHQLSTSPRRIVDPYSRPHASMSNASNVTVAGRGHTDLMPRPRYVPTNRTVSQACGSVGTHGRHMEQCGTTCILQTLAQRAMHKRRSSKKSKRCSHTGTRTRVCWVRASYPNRLDYMGRLDTPTTHKITTQHDHTLIQLLQPRANHTAPRITSTLLSRI